MAKSDLADLLALINGIWGTIFAFLALNYSLIQQIIVIAVVTASISIPLAISFRERKKKLPLFPFIPLRYYAAFMAMMTAVQCTEAVLLLYFGIGYTVLLLPALIMLPIGVTATILIVVLFACCIAMGVAMFAIAFLRIRAWKTPQKLDLAKELKNKK